MLFLFSIFAPDVTGSPGAHQPMARDEYATLYNNYQVIMNQFRLEGVVASSQPVVFGYSIRRDSTTATGQQYIEMGDSQYRVLGDVDSAKGQGMLTGKKFISSELGLAPNNDDLEASMGSDPSETLFLHIFAFAVAAGLDPPTMDVAITMDYHTKFREKKLLTQS